MKLKEAYLQEAMHPTVKNTIKLVRDYFKFLNKKVFVEGVNAQNGRENASIRITWRDAGDIPNEIRKKILELTIKDTSGVRDMNNINYGVINSRYISARSLVWNEFLKKYSKIREIQKL